MVDSIVLTVNSVVNLYPNMLYLINKLFKHKPIPYVIYYWHLERLLTTFLLFHFYLFSDYVYYTLNLHLFLLIITYKILRLFLIGYSKLETKYD